MKIIYQFLGSRVRRAFTSKFARDPIFAEAGYWDSRGTVIVRVVHLVLVLFG